MFSQNCVKISVVGSHTSCIVHTYEEVRAFCYGIASFLNIRIRKVQLVEICGVFKIAQSRVDVEPVEIGNSDIRVLIQFDVV